MKKKLCAVLLLAAALLGLLSFPTWAAEDTRVLASGECGATGNDVTWTLYRDGRFVVSGIGDMRDYTGADSLPWYANRNDIKTVDIQSGVTSVGNNAFRTCSNITSVSLPASLTRIGDVAFYQCSALAAVTIPESVTAIGANAFGYCALTTVTIPANVETIGSGVFFRCSALTAITVDAANANYSSTDGVLFDKAADEADPDKPTLIWYPAAKAGREYAVPDGTKKIGDYAFQSATNLRKVTLPSGVTEIGEWAFSYNPTLTDMELPKSLNNVKNGVKEYGIKDYAFYECTGLSTDAGEYGAGEVSFEGSRQDWSDMRIGTGNYRLTNAHVVPADMQQDNVIASGECGVQGSNASWSLSDKGELLISGTGAMLSYRSAANVPWANYRREEDNENEVAIVKVTVEGSVTRNDAGEITARKGVTNVGDYAFYDCESLTTVTLPPTLTTIGAQAFSGCPLLTDINLSETEVTSIGDYAFNGSSALAAVDFPETLKTISQRAFLRSGLTSVTIPAGVEEIGEWAFRWCDKMTAFAMEEPADDDASAYCALGAYAVADCAALTDVSFSEGLTVIGEYALSRCSALTSVAIPSGVTEIGACAFYGCSALTSIDVDEENSSYCTVNGMLLNKEQTCIFQYPSGRGRLSDSCAVSLSVNRVAAFAFDGASGLLKHVYYEGHESQWAAISIGDHNDPLTQEAEIHCEGPDPNDASGVASIDAFMVEETDEGRTAFVSVHCGENVLGAEALCATYDAEGRFVDMQSQELSPGTDDEISFELSEKAASVRLFIIDGYALPRCPAYVSEDLDAAS